MYGQPEWITPDMARTYLARSGGNRQIRKHRVDKYCKSRLAGKWYLTHQGIAFDETGVLRDGHHRLHMIVTTGLATWMFVVRDVPVDGVHHIDGILPRSDRDAFLMAGEADYQNHALAIAKVLYAMPSACKHEVMTLTRDELLERLRRHESAIAIAATPKGKGFSRGVRTLWARAHMAGVDEPRLREFIEVLSTGLPVSSQPEHDYAALAYAKFLNSIRSHNDEAELEKYRKGQTCLMSFLARRPMSKVYGTPDDLFPIPETMRVGQ